MVVLENPINLIIISKFCDLSLMLHITQYITAQGGGYLPTPSLGSGLSVGGLFTCMLIGSLGTTYFAEVDFLLIPETISSTSLYTTVVDS